MAQQSRISFDGKATVCLQTRRSGEVLPRRSAVWWPSQETRRIRGRPPAVTCMLDVRSFRHVNGYRKVDSATTLTGGFHARDQ
jgi:hypothetical protein